VAVPKLNDSAPLDSIAAADTKQPSAASVAGGVEAVEPAATEVPDPQQQQADDAGQLNTAGAVDKSAGDGDKSGTADKAEAETVDQAPDDVAG